MCLFLFQLVGRRDALSDDGVHAHGPLDACPVWKKYSLGREHTMSDSRPAHSWPIKCPIPQRQVHSSRKTIDLLAEIFTPAAEGMHSPMPKHASGRANARHNCTPHFAGQDNAQPRSSRFIFTALAMLPPIGEISPRPTECSSNYAGYFALCNRIF